MSWLLVLYSPFISASNGVYSGTLAYSIGIQFQSRGLVCIVRLGKMGVDNCGFQWISRLMEYNICNASAAIQSPAVGFGTESGQWQSQSQTQTRDSGSVIAKATRHGHSLRSLQEEHCVSWSIERRAIAKPYSASVTVAPNCHKALPSARKAPTTHYSLLQICKA
jgi:hypothetical protein